MSRGIFRVFSSCLALSIVAGQFSLLCGDEIVLQNGRHLTGKITRIDDRSVVIAVGNGSVELPRSSVQSVSVDSAATGTTPFALPTDTQAIMVLRSFGWSAPVFQIPATVVDTGVMKNVPYVSYRFADAYEMNVYGDLQRPACIEVGVYANRLQTMESKQHCLTFIYALIPELAANDATKGRKFSGDIVRIKNLTYEITPPEAADAYGAWWVSVYDEALLDKSRASTAELHAISTPTQALKPTPVADSEEWASSDLGAVRRNTPQPAAAPVTATTPVASSGSSPSSYGSFGRVYVRSYVRKDGTYVHSYTRRR